MNNIHHKTQKDELVKQITSGKFRECYLVYNRKSLDEPENQKNSIKYQKSENVSFLVKQKLELALITIPEFCTDGIISEKHSGFKEGNGFQISKDGIVQYQIDRPKFYRLVHYLSKGFFKGIICLCWDRISRNKADNVVIDKLLKRGIDIQFSHASYDSSSSGMLHMDIDGIFSEHHSRVTSEKVRLTFKKSREEGKWTNRAPIGYVNEGNMDWKPKDPIRAPIIKRLFELYSTGEWSLSDLTRYAKDQGLTTVPMRRRRTLVEILSDESDDDVSNIPKTSKILERNCIQKMLINPFYLGLVKGNNDTWVKSTSHEALVDKALFDKVQEMLSKKRTSIYYADKLPLPHRGLIRCICERTYTPYTKKGFQYFYSRCAPGCSNTKKSVSLPLLEDLISKKIKKLILSREDLELIDANIKVDVTVYENKRKTKLEEIENNKKRVTDDLSYLRDNKLSLLRVGAYTPEAFVSEETKLICALEKLSFEEKNTDVLLSEVVRDIMKLSEMLDNVYLAFLKADPFERDVLIRKIFSELIISENVLEIKCKKGLEPLERRLVFDCAQSHTFSELLRYSEEIRLSISELESIIVS